jgi:hypothetical protein
MIQLSLHPLPPSETSAFNKIRAFSTRRAGSFLSGSTFQAVRVPRRSASLRSHDASLANRWRRKRITKSFQIG